MTLIRDMVTNDPLSGGDPRPPSELSLVEIAGRLEKITSILEEQRARERTARKVYKAVADEVDQEIERIRDYARTLLLEQRRRLESFSGMLSRSPDPLPPAGSGRDLRELKLGPAFDSVNHARSSDITSHAPADTIGPATARLSISDAMLKIWTLEKYKRSLTTDEIAAALTDVGYSSKASPRSMKSTLNQVLARLCRERKIRRFRTDGTEIDAADTHSRARKYLLA